jgi:FkbM family methyltransferase
VLPLRWRALGVRLLKAFARAYPRARFVEIGANDGEFGSALRRFILRREWSGVLVEPSPRAYARLRENYRELDRIALENAAIAGHDGRTRLYELDPAAAGDPEWALALGSLDREHLVRQAPELTAHVTSEEVESLTFRTLCERHGIDALDLLVIDTEGHDHEILRQVDFRTIRPRLVIYEHLHLSPSTRADCDRLLSDAGYEQKREFFDTFCLDPMPGDRLTDRFRRLQPAIPPVFATP